jgi:hypothetical protein
MLRDQLDSLSERAFVGGKRVIARSMWSLVGLVRSTNRARQRDSDGPS